MNRWLREGFDFVNVGWFDCVQGGDGLLQSGNGYCQVSLHDCKNVCINEWICNAHMKYYVLRLHSSVQWPDLLQPERLQLPQRQPYFKQHFIRVDELLVHETPLYLSSFHDPRHLQLNLCHQLLCSSSRSDQLRLQVFQLLLHLIHLRILHNMHPTLLEKTFQTAEVVIWMTWSAAKASLSRPTSYRIFAWDTKRNRHIHTF